MSSSSKSASRGFLILTVVAIVVAGAAVAYQWSQQETKSTNKASKQPSSQPESIPLDKNEVVVEDDESDEEVDEQENEEAEKKRQAEEIAKQQKEIYDNYISVADKCVKGNSYARAADSYTLALEIAPSVPSASKNILTIYNNRSAMYEKTGEFEKSLTDIDIVLSIDPTHIKARIRKARIYEAQKEWELSMAEYAAALAVERLKGMPPGDHELKIVEQSKLLAAQRAGSILATIRSATLRSLPTNGYSRNFFDLLPCTHTWRTSFSSQLKTKGRTGTSGGAGLEALLEKYKARGSTADSEADVSGALDVVCCAIADGKFKLAFDTLAAIPHPLEPPSQSAALSRTAMLRHFLCGLESHLRCNLDQALAHYTAAISYGPDVSLALASVYRELGDEVKAETIYDAVLHGVVSRLTTFVPVAAAPSSSSDSSTKASKQVSEVASGAELEEGELIEDLKVSAVRPPEGDELEEGQVLESTNDTTVVRSPVALPAPIALTQFLRETAHGAIAASLNASVIAHELESSSDETCTIAWVLVHRHSLWSMRNSSGGFRANCVALAQQDLTLADALLQSVLGKEPQGDTNAQVHTSATMARVSQLIKQITLISQTKNQVNPSMQMGIEDRDQCVKCMKAAKMLAPTHESVMVLEADMLAMEEKINDALNVVDVVIQQADVNDGVPYVIKANFIAQKVGASSCSPCFCHNIFSVIAWFASCIDQIY